MTTDDMEIVSALRTTLADQVGANRFDMWFGPTTRLEFDGHCLTVGAPNRFFLEWIRTNFRRDIENACLENLGKRPELKFRIDPAADGPSTKRPDGPKRPDNSKQPAAKDADRPTPTSAESTASAESASAETSDPPSTGSNRRRFARLDSFVSGETNRLAFASAEMVVRRPGQMTPLMIHGPSGIGKTHLLEGIRTATRKTHRNLTTVYLSAEQFTTYFLEALRGSGLPSFRRKYRGVGLLLLAALQFLAGKRATQIELLHTIDTLLRDGRQLVFTADRPPEELAELGSELTTRLQSGMVCRIERPDYATRLGIVARMAERFEMNLPPEVQQFVASRLTNHARELSGALCRLQATSEALGVRIDVPLAEEALAEMIRHGSRAIRLGDIEKAVCDVFGLDPATLQSAGKAKRVSHPRMLAMWLARKHTRAALSEIGQFFGRRSHSTVVSAQKRVDGWMEEGTSVVLAEGTWNADEVIRRVERQLQAG